MSIKHAILGLLAEAPGHGYDLRAAFETQLAPQSRLNYGQVYTTLERLQRDGLVANEVVSQTERPDKKVYSVTDRGRGELAAWLSQPAKLELDLRNETYLKIMLARRLEGFDPLETIAIERRACLERMHDVAQARAKTGSSAAAAAAFGTRVLLDLALLRLEAFSKWLERCEELLSEDEGS